MISPSRSDDKPRPCCSNCALQVTIDLDRKVGYPAVVHVIYVYPCIRGRGLGSLIVSPYARADYVCSEVLDHTSVLKLIEEKWNLPALTARDAAAMSPINALDVTGPPVFINPPQPPAHITSSGNAWHAA